MDVENARLGSTALGHSKIPLRIEKSTPSMAPLRELLDSHLATKMGSSAEGSQVQSASSTSWAIRAGAVDEGVGCHLYQKQTYRAAQLSPFADGAELLA